jgi:transketolase C-terminal domain/subunit
MIYPTQKGHFAHYLYEEMKYNENIWLVLMDLGYGVFDRHKKDFKDRVINCGAAEQSAVGIAVGLALKDKIPFVYSIPNFMIYRPYEWIRNYVNYESIPIKMAVGGRDKEYSEDGFTHWSEDLKDVMKVFPNIKQYYPKDKSEIQGIVKEITTNGKPCLLSMTRST